MLMIELNGKEWNKNNKLKIIPDALLNIKVTNNFYRVLFIFILQSSHVQKTQRKKKKNHPFLMIFCQRISLSSLSFKIICRTISSGFQYLNFENRKKFQKICEYEKEQIKDQRVLSQKNLLIGKFKHDFLLIFICLNLFLFLITNKLINFSSFQLLLSQVFGLLVFLINNLFTEETVDQSINYFNFVQSQMHNMGKKKE